MSSTGSSARRTPSSISRLSSAISTRTARSSVCSTVGSGPALVPGSPTPSAAGRRSLRPCARARPESRLPPRSGGPSAADTVHHVLSRWLGRRVPLEPARLFALTAEPGGVLPRSVTVTHQELGELELPDGRVVACDPHDPCAPLGRRLPSGRYPAQLRVADLGGRDQRTAAVLLRARDEPPVRWEPDEHRLSVDSATGCLAGRQALVALQAQDALDALVEALGETEHSSWCWANHTVGPHSNVIAFTTGYGDGSYPLYWGLGAEGGPVCLLVALRVLDAGHDPALAGSPRRGR